MEIRRIYVGGGETGLVRQEYGDKRTEVCTFFIRDCRFAPEGKLV